MSIVIILVLFVVFLPFAFIIGDKKAKKRVSSLKEQYNGLEDFETSKKIEHYIFTDFIFAIDEKHSKVAYIDKDQVKIIPFEQIYKVEYIENSSTIASKSSIRTIGGALVGGALAGGAGVIVGGLSGDTKMKNNITLMQVKIGLRDINSPALLIKIFESEDGFVAGLDSSMSEYKEELEYANSILESVSVIIDKVDKDNNLVQAADSTHLSIADELNKLVQLKEMGVLTEQEFEQQKQKILNQ